MTDKKKSVDVPTVSWTTQFKIDEKPDQDIIYFSTKKNGKLVEFAAQKGYQEYLPIFLSPDVARILGQALVRYADNIQQEDGEDFP